MSRMICYSDIPVFREYGGDFPFYFKPMRARSIANTIEIALTESAARRLPPALRTWLNVADDYIDIYRDVLSRAGNWSRVR